MSKNWNDLPPEMKRKCINKMDFKMRTQLRSTSKTERDVVDSVKHVIDFLFLELDLKRNKFSATSLPANTQMELYCGVGHNEIRGKDEKTADLSVKAEGFDNVLKLLKQVFEHSRLERFEIRVNGEEADNHEMKLIREMIEEGPPLRVSQIELELDTKGNTPLSILKKCDNADLKIICIDPAIEADSELMRMFFEIPQAMAVEKVVVNNFHRFFPFANIGIDAIIRVSERWMVGNEEVGKEISMYMTPESALSSFESMFRERIIRKDEENDAVCFRMDDSTKQFWVRISPRDFYLQCFIVAASSSNPNFKEMDNLRIGTKKDYRNQVRQIQEMNFEHNFADLLGHLDLVDNDDDYLDLDDE